MTARVDGELHGYNGTGDGAHDAARLSMVAEQLMGGGRVLVTRLSYLGDVVLSLPLVDALQETFPGVEVDYLTRRDGADILRNEDRLSRVFELPESGGLAPTLGIVRSMRARKYDVAVDLYANPRSALLTRLSGAPVRIGGDRRGRRRMYTHPLSVPQEVRRASEHHMFHLTPLGITRPPDKPRLEISAAESDSALDLLRSLGVTKKQRNVGVHPGGKWEVKRWPAESFAEFADRIEAHGLRPVILCGPDEEPFTQPIRARLGDRAAFLPTMSVRDTAAVISVLDAMVLSDGGIMHVSVAVGTPTVGIFGSAEPDIWFPYDGMGPYESAWVPIECRPCHQHTCSHISCLRGLTVEMVIERLVRVMNAGDGGGVNDTARR